MIATRPSTIDDATAAERYRQLMLLVRPGEHRPPLLGHATANLLRWAAEQDAADAGVDDAARWRAAPETKPLLECGLPTPLLGLLSTLGMTTLGDLAACRRSWLWQQRRMGPAWMRMAQDSLTDHGLRFAGD